MGWREESRRRPLPEDDPWAVAERKSRALEEPLDVRLERASPFPILEVRNPLHRTVYRVMLPLFPDRSVALCTCTDFARRGLGTCKHIEAGGRWLERHHDAAPRWASGPPDLGGVWEEVDRRLADPRSREEPASRSWRRPGAVLVERAPPPWVEPGEGKEEVRRGGSPRPTRRTSRGRP
ncbi:MAG TPA: hypothetical protein VMI55_03725 [Thermoplasmata archaeon]|nr:hypothetical protein [Thermoplasmata archaeon]